MRATLDNCLLCKFVCVCCFSKSAGGKHQYTENYKYEIQLFTDLSKVKSSHNGSINCYRNFFKTHIHMHICVLLFLFSNKNWNCRWCLGEL